MSEAAQKPFIVKGKTYVMVEGALEKMQAERDAAGVLGWEVRLIDEKGKPVKTFMRGPETPEALIEAAHITFRNWTLVDFEQATTTRPTGHVKPVPPEAYQHGVLKSLHNLRRR